MIKDKLLIFDLDGTLIDSANGIYEAFNYCSKKMFSHQVDKKLFKKNIGPPIDKIFDAFFHDRSSMKELFINNFRYSYDNLYFKKFKLLINIDILKNLSKSFCLVILTNKPKYATNKILDLAGIRQYFKEIIPLDFYTENSSKKDNIINYLSDYHYKAKYYVGDTYEDLCISKIIKANFIGVRSNFNWQELNLVEEFLIIEINDILKYL